jgi:3-isopropylmalate/(R)-2-methylmalate dehydratase large subunit
MPQQPARQGSVLPLAPGSSRIVYLQSASMAQTLYDKLWDAHIVHQESDGTCLLYIDRHLLHEVTSPQAFEGLTLAGRKPWRTGANLAVADHNVPTMNRAQGIDDPISRLQVDTLDANCGKYGITEFRMNDLRQGADPAVVLTCCIAN